MNNITDFIPTGKENAVSCADLSQMVGINERAVREAIFRARCNEILVCSDDSGYYLPANIEEVERWHRRARSRALATLASLKKARRTLKDAGIDPDGGGNV